MLEHVGISHKGTAFIFKVSLFRRSVILADFICARSSPREAEQKSVQIEVKRINVALGK